MQSVFQVWIKYWLYLLYDIIFKGYSIATGKLVDSDCPSVVVLGAPHFLSTDGIVGSVSTRDLILFKEYF
jgi:hypothetical protein